MARRDALLRITKSLLTRRTELRKRLGMELDSLNVKSTAASGDSADVAFEHAGDELASHLAEVEAKELAQVERALTRIKQGKYGVCDGCALKIPVARLNALPYSTLCIKCQREAETDRNWMQDHATSDWSSVKDAEGERELDISDLEIDLSR